MLSLNNHKTLHSEFQIYCKGQSVGQSWYAFFQISSGHPFQEASVSAQGRHNLYIAESVSRINGTNSDVFFLSSCALTTY